MMIIRKFGIFLILFLVFNAAAAFSQDIPESQIRLSGQNFSSINITTGAVPKNTFAMNLMPFVNFAIDRVYLKLDHELGKTLSYHVIFDVAPDQFSSTTFSASTTNSYVPFLKNAFLRTKGGIENKLFFQFDAGLLNTPIIANRNRMSDTRWFEDTMHEGHKNLIGMVTAAPGAILKGVDSSISAIGFGDYDKSADLGLMLEIQIVKIFNITIGATTGEGWANVSKDVLPNYAGKAWYGDLFVEPIKGLYIHGYLRYENVQYLNTMDQVSPTLTGKDAWFTGLGAGINMKGIRAGADFETGQIVVKTVVASTAGNQAKNFFVLNAWLNWNFNEIAGFPMILVGRFSYGMFNDAYASFTGGTGVVYDTVFWSAGLGWQFNKNLRIILLFEMSIYSDAEIYMSMGNNPYNTDAMAIAKAANSTNGGWNNAASSVKIKSEVKF